MRWKQLKGNATSVMKCPICGNGQLTRETRSVPYSYRGVTVYVDQPADWCSACGEGLLSAADEAATAELRREAILRAKEN